ncbi:retinitis pigmentosa 1-like 1 protein isoform X2 [Vicugna pacos]
MHSIQRDAQAPGHPACLLPSVARIPSVTQVTPAKKITFLKRGDPRFAGVRLAVHQRVFRSFGALMDELSQRVPLSFGVRSVTTPRGLHGLSALEQLQDGGCYLCSDKKPPKTPSGPGRPPGRSPPAQPSRDFEGRYEAPGTSSSCKSLKTPRRITLVKNGDPRLQQTVVLSHRNTRNLSAFLSKASDLLHFTVKQVYTTSGKKVDSLKGLLCNPPVLVCAGHEPFRPLAMEDVRRNGTETLSGQTSRNKYGSWGPKAKQSIIHSRSRPGSRPRRSSLLSERSGLSDPSVSLPGACMGPAPDRHPRDMPVQLGPLVAGDDIEKNIRMNQDGSLSVEMKVRFHLLGEDPLLWSRRVRRASTLTAASGEGAVLGEADPPHCVWKGHPGDPTELGGQGLEPCKAGGMGAFDRGRWQPGSPYEIWMNPLYGSQGDQTASRRRPGPTQGSHSRVPRSQEVATRKRRSKDSISPASSDRAPEGSEPNSSCCSRSLEDGGGSCDLHLASRAGEGPGGGAAPGSRDHHSCLKPGTQGPTGPLSDSSASAGSHEESSERGGLHPGCPSKVSRVVTSRGTTQQGGRSPPTVSPSSLRNEDPQAEVSGQGSRHPPARSGSGLRLPLALGRAGPGDDAGGRSPLSACASAPGGSRKQEGRASRLSSPGTSASRGAQGGRPRPRHSSRDPHSLLGSLVSKSVPGTPSRGGARPDGPAPGLSESPRSARKRPSRDPGPPFSASLHSQDTRGLSSAPITPVSNSDCASNFYPPNSPSAETGPEFRACSPAPTPSNTSDSLSSQADGLGGKAGGDGPKASWPLVLPVGWPEGGRWQGSHRGSCCSQMSVSPACGSPGGKTWPLPTSQPRGSQGPSSEACLVCSRYCPTPPSARPAGKKHTSCSHSHSVGDHGADGRLGGGKAREGKQGAWRPRPPDSQTGAAGRAVRAVRRGSPHSDPRLGRMFQGRFADGGEGLGEQEEGGGLVLGALPRASPEAVVRAWLSNIPEEPGPVKYERVDESMDGAGHGPEGPAEDPGDERSPDGLEGPIQARGSSLEGAASEKAEPDGALPVPGGSDPKSGDSLPCSRVSGAPMEVGTGKGAAADCGMGQSVLPSRVSASIQIMKALMGSKQGRPSSLPEVSSSKGKRLSRSAQALITCLARLRFFDDHLGSPAGKGRFMDSPRYQELLSTFQALWPGCGLGHQELDSGLRELGWGQALPGPGSHAATEDFTPTSSSGVDVASGSGGSGDGSGPCVVGCTPAPERMELPLNIPCQRPDSRTSGNPEDLGTHQPSDSDACATSKDAAKRNSEEQLLGSDLDQGAENMMQEEKVELEEMKEEKESAELQEEGVKGFPEEEGVTGQELSGMGSQDGMGAREDRSLQEEEEGDPPSATLSPPGRKENPTEGPRSLREGDFDAIAAQSGSKAELTLEKLPKATETGCGQTQAALPQGAGETGPPTPRRGSLGPDPLWVSRLLKKMEKAFMAHLASATAELRARWDLPSNDLLDQMVAELQQDVGQRLQDSVEKELRKVQSRAGATVPGPPREALQWEVSPQAEQRRRRLRGLRDLSAFSEQMRGWGPPSFSLEDAPALSAALGARLEEEAGRDEFCPCEACVRKKVVPASLRDKVGVASTPIREAFDLQQILQKKKGGCVHLETKEAAPAKREMEPLQRDPSGTGAIQGADGGLELGSGQGPGVAERGEAEGSRTLDRDEDPQGAGEEAAAQKREGQTDTCGGSDPEGPEMEERGVGGKEENSGVGSGAEDTLEGDASGGGDQSLGGQNAGADPAEAQEAEGEPQPKSGEGHGDEEEGGPQAGPADSQWGEASGNGSPDWEGRPTLSPAPGADTPRQRSGPTAGLSSSSASSLGKCSQLSQKGSEDEPSDRHTRTAEDESKGISGPERKVTGMCPESSTSEQEGDPSGSRTPEQREEEGPTSEHGEEKGLTPEQGEEEGLTPEQGEEEGPTPEQGEEEGPTSEHGEEKGLTPEHGEEEGLTSEQGEEEGPTPEQGEEEGLTPEQGEEEGPTPEQGEEEGPTSEQGEEEGPTPEQGEEEGPTSVHGEEKGLTPEHGEEEGLTPEQGAEEGPTPEQGEEEGLTPEQGEEEGLTPEQGEEEGPTSEHGEEKGLTPEHGEEEGLTSEQGEEEGPTPEQGEEEGLTPEQGEEEGPTPEQGEEEGPTSEQGEEEGLTPEQGEEEGPTSEHGEEKGLTPEHGEEEGLTPEQGEEEGLTPEHGEEKDSTPGQRAEESSDLEDEKVVKSLTSTEMRFKKLPTDRTDGFDQDDLDF